MLLVYRFQSQMGHSAISVLIWGYYQDLNSEEDLVILVHRERFRYKSFINKRGNIQLNIPNSYSIFFILLRARIFLNFKLSTFRFKQFSGFLVYVVLKITVPGEAIFDNIIRNCIYFMRLAPVWIYRALFFAILWLIWVAYWILKFSFRCEKALNNFNWIFLKQGFV